jgi:hypothetical protein
MLFISRQLSKRQGRQACTSDIDPGELKNLIVTRPRMGNMLHLDGEDIAVL